MHSLQMRVEARRAERILMNLSFTAKMAVFLVTALGGTGFLIGLLLLAWSLLGGYWSEFLLFFTAFSGVVALIGLFILRLSKNELPETD